MTTAFIMLSIAVAILAVSTFLAHAAVYRVRRRLDGYRDWINDLERRQNERYANMIVRLVELERRAGMINGPYTGSPGGGSS